MNKELADVKRSFASHQVVLSDIWLESCYAWCKEESLPANYTLKDLENQVYQQWLLLDLRDVDVPSLPPRLSSKKQFVLNGNFCLQVMQVIDISKPKLWQLQRIRNFNPLTRTNKLDADQAGTGKRMLKLTLSDGVQEVDAIEYKPIASLSINMPPGIKVRIVGPVTVRRGELLLEERNIKILGGEVEELLISNAAENVLAKLLNLPLNPKPLMIQDNILSTEPEHTLQDASGNKNQQPKVEKNESSSMKNVSSYSKSTREIRNHHPAIQIVDELDEKMIQEEIKILLEAEECATSSKCEKSKTPDLFEDVELDPGDFNVSKQIKASTQVQPKKYNNRDITLNEDEEEDDFLIGIDIDAHLNAIEDNKTEKSKPEALQEFVSIFKLNQYHNEKQFGDFKVKGKFESIVEKLTIDQEYHLVIKITDNKNEIDVRVHSDIVSDFIGYRPDSITRLKHDILLQDKDAEGKLIKALKKLKDKLLLLDKVMEIKISQNERFPTIIRICDEDM